MNQAKAEWFKGLIENNITSDLQIEAGLSKARTHDSPFLPSIGQFIGWCKEATEPQWPPLEACYAELMQFIGRNRKDTYNLPQFLYHTVTRNLDLYTFKQLEREYDRQKAFEVAYKATLFQLETGHELASPPAPETLLESDKPKKAAPDVVEKTADIRNSLLSMFDEPEAKPLTDADKADLERLERLKNGH